MENITTPPPPSLPGVEGLTEPIVTSENARAIHRVPNLSERIHFAQLVSPDELSHLRELQAEFERLQELEGYYSPGVAEARWMTQRDKLAMQREPLTKEQLEDENFNREAIRKEAAEKRHLIQFHQTRFSNRVPPVIASVLAKAIKPITDIVEELEAHEQETAASFNVAYSPSATVTALRNYLTKITAAAKGASEQAAKGRDALFHSPRLQLMGLLEL